MDTCPVCQVNQLVRNSKRCQQCYRKEMSERNRREAPERMRLHNPMFDVNARNKMRCTLKRIGWKPIVRGGNGKPLAVPHKMMADALSLAVEYPIPTRVPKGNGYPTCYKVDLAETSVKLAVEIDGNSHIPLTRQAQDRKKEELLRRLGWTVLRFSNAEVIRNLSGCVQTVTSTISKLKQHTPTLPIAS